jgi:MGT family glycosyltransferase
LRGNAFAHAAFDNLTASRAVRLNGLFFGFPARSHTVPSLPVVRALLSRGASIKYYSTPRFRPLIESAGIEFAAYPADCEHLGAAVSLAGHVERVLEVMPRLLPRLYGEIGERPSFVMFDSQALWGRIIARELAAVSVASITTFALTRSMLLLISHARGGGLESPQLAEKIARLNQIDIADYADVIVATGDIKLVYTSRFFQPGGRFFDGSHLFVGPLLDGRPRDGAGISPSGDRPLAYLSFGTIFTGDLGLLNRVSRILSEAGWQVVVSLGDPDSKVEGEWAPHVQVHPFVDQMAVLSRASLVATHGGMSSVSEALAHGIPLVIVPQSIDQHLVGRRVAELGAAIVLDDASSADQWKAALLRIGAEPAKFAAAAARIGDSFADVVPVTSAVETVLRLVKTE